MACRLAALLALFCLAPTASGDVAKVRLQLRWEPGMQFAGYLVARERGLYQKAGLEVKFLPGGMGVDHVTRVADGQAEFGVAGSELLVAWAEQRPVVALGPIFQHSPYAIMVRREAGVTNPHELIGRRVRITGKDRAPELWAMLMQEGVTPDKLVLINPTAAADKLNDPSITALSCYLTNEVLVAEERGMDMVLLLPAAYGIDFYGDTLFTSGRLADDAPDLAARFKEASLAGWRLAFEHPEDTVQLVAGQFNPHGKSRQRLASELEAMRRLILPDQIPVGTNNLFRWERMAEVLADLELMPPLKDLEGFIFDPQAERSRHLRGWVLGLGLFLAAACAAAILTMVFNARLRRQVERRTAELEAERSFLRQIVDASANLVEGDILTLVVPGEKVIHPVTKKPKSSWDSGLGSGALPNPPSCEALNVRQHLLGVWSSRVPPEIETVDLSVGEAFTASVRKTGEGHFG